MIEFRIRSRLADALMGGREGKLPGAADYDALLTGHAVAIRPDGRPLCVLLPAAVTAQMDAPGVYEVLHELRMKITRNRGMASGTPRFRTEGPANGRDRRSYTRPISSAVAGALEQAGQMKYCRLTSWTGANLPSWELLRPLLLAVSGHLEANVPARYAAQLAEAGRTDPAWVVPGTPFSTITVNNSYATGVHKDKGDLDAGFSTICCLRRGEYAGGLLVFPQYRLAADLHHGDLILMDAHDWHGNTQLTCKCGKVMNGCCETCGAERISVVAYFRTRLTGCGSPEQELARATAWHERTGAARAARGSDGPATV